MLANMLSELQGTVPNIDGAYASTLINEAWQDVRRLGGWSFQFGQTGFTVPGLLGTGTVTLTFGSDQVVGDADAAAAWLTPGIGSQYGSLITQRQFRSGGTSGAGTMYDIIAFDGIDTLTLDRPFSEARDHNVFSGNELGLNYLQQFFYNFRGFAFHKPTVISYFLCNIGFCKSHRFPPE